MRFDGHDPIDRDREEAGKPPLAALPLDAAESAWDPWLWALYLRELAETKTQPSLH